MNADSMMAVAATHHVPPTITQFAMEQRDAEALSQLGQGDVHHALAETRP